MLCAGPSETVAVMMLKIRKDRLSSPEVPIRWPPTLLPQVWAVHILRSTSTRYRAVRWYPRDLFVNTGSCITAEFLSDGREIRSKRGILR